MLHSHYLLGAEQKSINSGICSICKQMTCIFQLGPNHLGDAAQLAVHQTEEASAFLMNPSRGVCTDHSDTQKGSKEIFHRWEGPLGTPLGLVHWKRASSPVEAGTAGYL